MNSASLSLPPGLEASLAVTAPRRVLLLRHADRPPILEGATGDELGLTAEGEARARLLGERLGAEPRWALTSPLVRCRRTASLAGLAAEPSALLGAPGPFVIDSARGGVVFGAHGTDVVVRAQLRGETWECMRGLAEGARLVLNELCMQLEAHEGTGLAVSHDAIVMPIVAWVTGETFEGDWLAPLDGAVLTPGFLFWKGCRYEVNR
jgi:hypothetical protein